MLDCHHSRVGFGVHLLDAVDRPALEKRKHRVPVVRRTVRKLEHERGGEALGTACLAQPPGRHPVARLEQRVEAPHARKTAGARDFRDGQRRIGQQPLREQQALRLRILDRRDAELRFENSPQVATRNADARCQMLDAACLENAIFDEIDRTLRETSAGIDAFTINVADPSIER